MPIAHSPSEETPLLWWRMRYRTQSRFEVRILPRANQASHPFGVGEWLPHLYAKDEVLTSSQDDHPKWLYSLSVTIQTVSNVSHRSKIRRASHKGTGEHRAPIFTILFEFCQQNTNDELTYETLFNTQKEVYLKSKITHYIPFLPQIGHSSKPAEDFGNQSELF